MIFLLNDIKHKSDFIGCILKCLLHGSLLAVYIRNSRHWEKEEIKNSFEIGLNKYWKRLREKSFGFFFASALFILVLMLDTIQTSLVISKHPDVCRWIKQNIFVSMKRNESERKELLFCPMLPFFVFFTETLSLCSLW